MKGLSFNVCDVLGDGNCGLYTMLLGLANIGKVPPEVLLDNNNTAAAAYKLRVDLHNQAEKLVNDLWNKIPKDDKDVAPDSKAWLTD